MDFMSAAEVEVAEYRRMRNCPWHGRILPDITMLISDVCEGHAHPDTVLFPGTIQRRLTAFRRSLEAVCKAYEGLGERVQWHFNNQFSPRDDGKFLQLMQGVLVAVSHAQERPVHPMIASVQEQGAPKNHAMRLIVMGLLEIFERVTGVKPTVYASQHTKDGYAGTFYPFAVACLAAMGLVPRKQLGSAIRAVYKEWSRSCRTKR
jgi:hypothetical protein